MKNKNLVTIVIATFNSSKTLPFVLESISKQTYPQSCIEILIIDGGSTDTTLQIAKKFHCITIKNKKVEPLYAKYLGYIRASGQYIVYIDHDEVLQNMQSIEQRIMLFQKHSYIKAIVATGYESPPGYHVINKYINEFGDPFSFFIYRLSKHKDIFLRVMKQRYKVVSDTKNYSVVDLSSSKNIPIIELGAGGGMLDGMFFKRMFPEIKKEYHLIAHFLHLIRDSYPCLGIMKNDVLMHYSSDTLQSYIQKIIWRIKNNIFYANTIGASGFTGREAYQSNMMKWKKYLFIPYACSVIFPIIDAIYLMITRRDYMYIIHVPLTLFTFGCIVYYLTLRLVGIKPTLTSYDGSTKAYEKN